MDGQEVGNVEVLRQLLAKMVGPEGLNENVTIKYEGAQIVLPEGMTEDEAISTLIRRRDENMEDVTVQETIPGYPLDALLGLQRAMAQTYGWTGMVPTPGFWADTPPQMLGINVDADGTTISVPWGRMVIPGIEGWITPVVQMDAQQQPQLLLAGEVQRRFLGKIQALAALARKEVRERSIYKGKAIRINFPEFGPHNPFNPTVHVPQFMQLRGVSRDDIVLNKAAEWAVQTSIFTPIEQIERLREMNTPFGSGILTAGEYGVGKTLLANVTAKVCEDNGVTFIYLTKTSDLIRGREFARQYAPAVLFAEDVDSILSGEERDEAKNRILNIIDGVDTKKDEVMVIFSTNHPDRINRGLLRPGRIDAVIFLDTPDSEAAQRLIRLYARDTLDPKVDISEVGQMVQGNMPSSIRQIVERAKKAALFHTEKGEKVVLKPDDLLNAAASMKGHLDMLKSKPQQPRTVVERASEVLGDALGDALGKAIVQVNGGGDHKQAQSQ